MGHRTWVGGVWSLETECVGCLLVGGGLVSCSLWLAPSTRMGSSGIVCLIVHVLLGRGMIPCLDPRQRRSDACTRMEHNN